MYFSVECWVSIPQQTAIFFITSKKLETLISNISKIPITPHSKPDLSQRRKLHDMTQLLVNVTTSRWCNFISGTVQVCTGLYFRLRHCMKTYEWWKCLETDNNCSWWRESMWPHFTFNMCFIFILFVPFLSPCENNSWFLWSRSRVLSVVTFQICCYLGKTVGRGMGIRAIWLDLNIVLNFWR